VLIDWFTVIAQLVNFIVLVVILKFLLFDRVVKAMAEREQRIQGRLDEAGQKRQEARESAREYEEKTQALERERRDRLQEARDAAEQRRKELTREAREEADRLRERWQQRVRDEQASFLRDLRRQAGEQVVATTRAALRDLANEDLEGAAVEAFLRALGEDDETRKALRKASDGGAVTVFTAFDPGEDRKDHILDALGNLLGDGTEVTFDTDDDLVCGLEVRAGGHALGWHVAGYLDRLGEEFRASLNKQQETREEAEGDASSRRVDASEPAEAREQ
jgi:F-type H+-transporting ATPase subunit b